MRLFSLIVLFLCLAMAGAAAELDIRIVYDNTTLEEGIEADWGFAAVVTHRGRTVLFDSGTKPDLFLRNLAKLEIDPASIGHAVFSHQHGDHTNGIFKLYPKNRDMKVYFLDSFIEERYQQAAAVGMKPVRVTGPREIVPGVYTTGQVDGPVAEQALVIETEGGLVVVTGCSHPGVVKLVEAAEKQRGKDSVRLVVGGFHMGRQSEAEVLGHIKRLKELNVQRVIPTHCTGDAAIELFRREFGDRFDKGGAGKRIVLD